MHYLKIKWAHEYPDDPVLLYSECDVDGWEMRKIEIFRDGRIGRASSEISIYGSMLAIEPIEPISEINSQPEFTATHISEEEFERAWSATDGYTLLVEANVKKRHP